MKTQQPHQRLTTALVTLLLIASLCKAAILCSCQDAEPTSSNTPERAINHWKNTFAPNDGEQAFTNQHQEEHVYMLYSAIFLPDGAVQPEQNPHCIQ